MLDASGQPGHLKPPCAPSCLLLVLFLSTYFTPAVAIVQQRLMPTHLSGNDFTRQDTGSLSPLSLHLEVILRPSSEELAFLPLNIHGRRLESLAGRLISWIICRGDSSHDRSRFAVSSSRTGVHRCPPPLSPLSSPPSPQSRYALTLAQSSGFMRRVSFAYTSPLRSC